jgi:hypothetical protein
MIVSNGEICISSSEFLSSVTEDYLPLSPLINALSNVIPTQI